MAKGGWVYIMANRYRGGTYVGVSADVISRAYQHRQGTGSRHVTDFGKTRLVCGDYAGPGRSPDRADALVWALSELMLGRRSEPRVVQF